MPDSNYEKKLRDRSRYVNNYFRANRRLAKNHSQRVNIAICSSTFVDVGSAEGLAYDEFFQELYWTSYTNSSISRINVSPHRFVQEREKIVQLEPDDHPRAIVVDSCES